MTRCEENKAHQLQSATAQKAQITKPGESSSYFSLAGITKFPSKPRVAQAPSPSKHLRFSLQKTARTFSDRVPCVWWHGLINSSLAFFLSNFRHKSVHKNMFETTAVIFLDCPVQCHALPMNTWEVICHVLYFTQQKWAKPLPWQGGNSLIRCSIVWVSIVVENVSSLCRPSAWKMSVVLRIGTAFLHKYRQQNVKSSIYYITKLT